jgi:UDP:flavonoid glycosyltransferase YjiC (YdhE family)
MSEAVFLHKPMLSVPITGQFEQVLNALYLEKLNYGLHAKSLEGDVLGRFLECVPSCQKALAAYAQEGNALMLASLDAQLAAAAQKKGVEWDTITTT